MQTRGDSASNHQENIQIQGEDDEQVEVADSEVDIDADGQQV